jgi:glycosyltransferase involved in cell wall biosynthesis
MRVLMVGRQDMDSVPGGDTIQMRETKLALEKLGVDVTTAAAGAVPPVSGFDILHIFNLDQAEQVLASQKDVLNGKPRIVVSTIYWHHTGHWFNEAVRTRPSWKLVRRTLGYARSQRLYAAWQSFKLRRGKQGRSLKQALSIPAQILPNSRAEVDHLRSVLGARGIPPSKITIVPNGVKRDLFDPHPLPDSGFSKEYGLKGFVLEAARIQSAKNQLLLIEALFDLPVPIVFAGQASPYEREYVERCYARGAERGNVHFIGAKSPGELAGIYALASVHVLPSWRETPGLASLEAAAAGCRVVSTDVGSAREYFQDLAWYCDPRDPASIRQAVVEALKAPPSNRLRTRVLERFTWEMAAKATLTSYIRALDLN